MKQGFRLAIAAKTKQKKDSNKYKHTQIKIRPKYSSNRVFFFLFRFPFILFRLFFLYFCSIYLFIFVVWPFLRPTVENYRWPRLVKHRWSALLYFLLQLNRRQAYFFSFLSLSRTYALWGLTNEVGCDSDFRRNY